MTGRTGGWALAVAAGLAMAACTEAVPDEPQSTGSQSPAASPVDAVASIERSVVSVEIYFESGHSIASGVVLTADGYVLTPMQGIDREVDSLTVTFDGGESREATPVGSDSRSQLAVIKVEGAADLAPAVFSDRAPEVGDEVRLVGGPQVQAERVSSGSVTALGAPFGSVGVFQAETAAAALGSAGGPLVDAAGEVVGITVGSTDVEGGASLAVPSALASWIADQLVAGEPVIYPFLGVSVEDAGGGAAVQDLSAGSPAAQAGLQAGDVITQVGDHPVDTAGDVVYAVQLREVGEQVTVTYTRDGSEQDTTVTLGEAPAQ